MPQSIDEAFARIELPTPETPARWAPLLKEKRPWLFCTGDPPRRSLLDIDFFLEAAILGGIGDGLIIALERGGAKNCALHYYLIEEDLVLLLQLPWEAADVLRKDRERSFFVRALKLFRKRPPVHGSEDRDQNAHRIRQTFAALPSLFRELERLRSSSRKPPGRLAVVLRRDSTACWGWAPQDGIRESSAGLRSGDPAARSARDWIARFDDDVIGEALRALNEL